MKEVAFITLETGDDLIVSFAINDDDDDLSDVKSLTLLRTLKYEFVLDDDERGVTASYDDYEDEDRDLLKSIEFKQRTATIVTQRRKYSLDLRRVDGNELIRAVKVLERMNFDKRFVLKTSELPRK